MLDEYSPHIYVNGKAVRMSRGSDGSWVPQVQHTNKHSRVQDVVWKNGDEDDASRIMDLLRDGQQPLYEIANHLRMGFRRVERLLSLLQAKGDVEVERGTNGQQWRIS